MYGQYAEASSFWYGNSMAETLPVSPWGPLTTEHLKVQRYEDIKKAKIAFCEDLQRLFQFGGTIHMVSLQYGPLINKRTHIDIGKRTINQDGYLVTHTAGQKHEYLYMFPNSDWYAISFKEEYTSGSAIQLGGYQHSRGFLLDFLAQWGREQYGLNDADVVTEIFLMDHAANNQRRDNKRNPPQRFV